MNRALRTVNIILTVLIFGGFIALAIFVYKDSYLRVWESIQDLWNSLKFFVKEVFMLDFEAHPSVIDYSKVLHWQNILPEDFGKFKLKTEEADRIYTPPTDNEDDGDDGDDGSKGGGGDGGSGREYEDGETMDNFNKKCGDIEPGCPAHQVCCGGACYDQWNIPKYYIGASCGFKDANGNTAYVTHDTNIH